MYTIGIDLGGTNIAVGIVNTAYEIVAKGSIPTNAKRPADEITADIAALCKKLTADAGLTMADIRIRGMARPDANRASGVSSTPTSALLYDPIAKSQPRCSAHEGLYRNRRDAGKGGKRCRRRERTRNFV